ncbi:MAG: 50S ribosomal protein L32 [Chlamydiota bacterium]
MAVPRNRHSNARKNSRRAHDAKREKQAAVCSNCKKMHLPHRICPFCGQYKGRPFLSEETAE